MSEITITLTCSERQMLLIVNVAWKKASSFLIKTGAKIISDPKLKNVFSHFLFIRPFGQMFIGQRFCFLTARADFFSVYDKKIFFLHLEKAKPFKVSLGYFNVNLRFSSSIFQTFFARIDLGMYKE